MVRMGGLEPPRLTPPDPKSGAATITPHPRFFEGAKVQFFSTRATAAETVSEFACEPGGSRLGGLRFQASRGARRPPHSFQKFCIFAV